jgi:uncharacterized membrane protein YedE/YeeE
VGNSCNEGVITIGFIFTDELIQVERTWPYSLKLVGGIVFCVGLIFIINVFFIAFFHLLGLLFFLFPNLEVHLT